MEEGFEWPKVGTTAQYYSIWLKTVEWYSNIWKWNPMVSVFASCHLVEFITLRPTLIRIWFKQKLIHVWTMTIHLHVCFGLRLSSRYLLCPGRRQDRQKTNKRTQSLLNTLFKHFVVRTENMDCSNVPKSDANKHIYVRFQVVWDGVQTLKNKKW